MARNKSHFVIDDDEKNQDKLKEIAGKYKRIDGKDLTGKQKEALLKQMEEEKNEDNFDPRQHRLRHGIRNYKIEH